MSSSAVEPIAGWTDNYMGVTGLTIGVLRGFVRFLPTSRDVAVDIVPVDYTINGLIASAWDVVYNCSSRYDQASTQDIKKYL